jgi:hypothetical protein
LKTNWIKILVKKGLGTTTLALDAINLLGSKVAASECVPTPQTLVFDRT